MTEYRITDLERAPEGHWQARIVTAGGTIDAHRRYGSWLATVGESLRDVRHDVAAELQGRVRQIEKRERRA